MPISGLMMTVKNELVNNELSPDDVCILATNWPKHSTHAPYRVSKPLKVVIVMCSLIWYDNKKCAYALHIAKCKQQRSSYFGCFKVPQSKQVCYYAVFGIGQGCPLSVAFEQAPIHLPLSESHTSPHSIIYRFSHASVSTSDLL